MPSSKTSKGWDIVLDSYERHSFFRFFLIYTVALLLLFTALASLYYYKEHRRYYQEEKVRNKLLFSECQHLKKMLPSAADCHMRPVIITNKVKTIYQEILMAFMVALVLVLLLGYFLARLSLRPMRESVMAMDGFINGIVHDINTPLSVIRMNAQSISKMVSDPKANVKVSRLLQAVAQVESFEEQLLFSVRAGQYELQAEYFDLGETLLERKVYWSSLRSSISIEVESQWYPVFADRAALLRMIDNIVLNAIKYSRPKRKVEILLEHDVLSVQDHGVGIKHPKKVFHKYYREARESEGIGLGLYIVAHVARLHGLKVDITSQIGKGSLFLIDLTPISTSRLHGQGL